MVICEAADVIACGCPGYLARLLRQVQSFRSYTTQCSDSFPEAQETHLWLSARAAQLEKVLAQTILELLRKEGLIDDAKRLSLTQLSEQTKVIALRQIGYEP